MIIIGTSNFGKTESMIFLLKNCKPLFLKDLNTLGNLTFENKVIILDNIRWLDVCRENIIGLLNK